MRHNGSEPRRFWDVAGVLLFLLVLVAVSVRQYSLFVIPGEPQRSHALGRNGLGDFRDVIYYPVQAVQDGVNPYDCRTEPLPDGSPRYRHRYPILNAFPLYSPLLFALYWPWSYLDFVPSAILYVAVNVGLLLVFADMCWRTAGRQPSIAQTTILASVMLMTQAGRANFLGGETALPLAIASLAAVRLAPRNPWLAGLALFVTSFKLTFGLPLGILLLACGHFRTVALGWTLGLVVALSGLILIFAQSGDLPQMLEILVQNQEALEADPDADARSSAIRLDSAGALERLSPASSGATPWIATAIVLAIASAGLWPLAKLKHNPEAELLTAAIATLATISSMFHVTYDGVLIWAAIACVWLAPRSCWPNASIRWRLGVAALLFVPMINVLGTKTVTNLIVRMPGMRSLSPAWSYWSWALVGALSGMALLAALGLMVGYARRLARLEVQPP